LRKPREPTSSVKASGVGVFDTELLEASLRTPRPDALKLFWDVDAAATLDEMRGQEDHVVRRCLPDLDMVLTYGGGPPVIEAYEGFGAARCIPSTTRSTPPPTIRSSPIRLRRRPRLPRQPPSGPRGAGGGILPERPPPRCRSAAS
jgi:hypothetical protein